MEELPALTAPTSAGTVYNYSMQPSLFLEGATGALFTLTIFHPSASFEPAEAVEANCDGSGLTAGDLISVTVPQGSPGAPNILVNIGNASQIQSRIVSSPSSQPWTTAVLQTARGAVVRIAPQGGGSLSAGQTVVVQIFGLVITETAGSPQIQILETLAGSGSGSTTLPATVAPAGLNVSAVANPAVVGLGQQAAILWSASGGSTVTISGGAPPAIPPIPLVGSGPVISGSTLVTPLQSQAQTVITATVKTQDNQQQSAVTTINLSSPIVQEFAVASPGPYGLDDSVTLAWAVDFATQVFLTPTLPPGPGQVPPSGSKGIVPRSYYPAGGNTSALTFTLATRGFAPAPTSAVPLQLAPAQVLYFGYPSPTTTNAVNQNVVNGFVSIQRQGELFILTVNGPGGPLTRYCGPSSHLEIQYFGVSPSPSPAPGTPVTLQWITLNAMSIEIQPGGFQSSSASGTTTVSPQATTTYMLTATGSGGAQISYQINLIVESALEPAAEEA